MYISDVAVSVGLTAQALRFYERLGLVDKPQRTSGGYRVYSAKTLEQVQFIKDAERLGFSLDEVREILRLKYSGQSPCDCVREMLNQKLKPVQHSFAVPNGGLPGHRPRGLGLPSPRASRVWPVNGGPGSLGRRPHLQVCDRIQRRDVRRDRSLGPRIALEHLAAIRGDVPAILRGLKKNQSTYTS